MRLFLILSMVWAIALARSVDLSMNLFDRADAPISTDSKCGSNSANNATCLGSKFGDCCSSAGFCGGGKTYCTAGCQASFGTCSNLSTDGNCGNINGVDVTCKGSRYGDCCSAHGFCGGTTDYCAVGCQSAFGTCEKSATKDTSSAASASASATKSTSSASASDQPASLSSGAIAGIVVGSLAVVSLALVAVFWFWLRNKRKAGAATAGDMSPPPPPKEYTSIRSMNSVSMKSDVHEVSSAYNDPHEMQGSYNKVFEAPSPSSAHEMAGPPVPPKAKVSAPKSKYFAHELPSEPYR